MRLEELLSRFQYSRKIANGYQVRCPAHDDQKASLSIREGDKGLLLYCHAGCDTSKVLQTLNVELEDLFFESHKKINGYGANGHHSKGNGSNGGTVAAAAARPVPLPKPVAEKSSEPAPRILTAYDYKDEQGQLLYQVLRYEPKDFRQRRPDPDRPGQWLWNLQNTRRVLYRLPEILAAHSDATIWVVEGEKDADALASLGAVATSSVGGAGKWRDEYSESLTGRDVVIIPDNDPPGLQHALTIRASVKGLARSVVILNLPGLSAKGDVSDWLQFEGNDAERLCLLAESATTQSEAQVAPRETSGEQTEPKFWRRTHEGLARELITRCAGNLRWIADFARDLRGDNAWAWWDGKSWVFDAAAVAHVSAVQRSMSSEYRDYCREIIKNVGGIFDALDTESKAEIRFSKEIESAAFKTGWKSEVKAFGEIHVSITDFDKNPFLLTCSNGLLDLRSATLTPFDRDRFCSKKIPLSYEPNATAPLWEAFLNRIFAHNENLIRYLQRAIGYSLTGDTSEQCLFLCHGAGANGKSVLLDVILQLLGEFGMDAPMSTFTVKQQQTASNDLAMLRAARYVTASETNEGVRLDEALVKKATGQDKLTARKLYQEFFSYQPQFKLWLAMNHKPSIRGVDNGIWRRIRLIPFSVIIPESEQDKNLKRKLLLELPGILAWAVRGCLEWQRAGMQTPDEVIEATKDYRSEQDVLGAFLEECCILGEHYQVPSRQLYHSYRSWAEEAGEYVMSQTLFGRRLGDRGFETSRVHGGTKKRKGLTLINP